MNFMNIITYSVGSKFLIKAINPSKSPFSKFDPKTILFIPCVGTRN